MKKILILSDLFIPPYDEGMKVTAFNLLKGIRHHTECIGLGPCGDQDGLIRTISINKALYSDNLCKEIKRYNPDFIFYIPEASATLHTFMRYRILRFISSETKTALIVLQNREYSFLTRKMIMLFCPDRFFVPSARMSAVYKKMGIQAHVLSPGVDLEKFVPVSPERKCALREKYHISKDKFVVLHIGHIRKSRNVEIFLNFPGQSETQVLLVGSTSTQQEEELKRELQRAGVSIIDTFIQKNQELYQLADCYVFNVIERNGAMEFPLSVLEAIACNLPVVTTPFGSLPENFPASDDFRYFTTVDELKTELQKIRTVVSRTREKAKTFSWESIARQLLEKCNAL
ncbi:MAG: glycosyltransferase [wastewater metagenome]|nr:glycosyltransferase [Candidatus Loosdrechtia aerotolerans]